MDDNKKEFYKKANEGYNSYKNDEMLEEFEALLADSIVDEDEDKPYDAGYDKIDFDLEQAIVAALSDDSEPLLTRKLPPDEIFIVSFTGLASDKCIDEVLKLTTVNKIPIIDIDHINNIQFGGYRDNNEPRKYCFKINKYQYNKMVLVYYCSKPLANNLMFTLGYDYRCDSEFAGMYKIFKAAENAKEYATSFDVDSTIPSYLSTIRKILCDKPDVFSCSTVTPKHTAHPLVYTMTISTNITSSRSGFPKYGLFCTICGLFFLCKLGEASMQVISDRYKGVSNYFEMNYSDTLSTIMNKEFKTLNLI